MSTERFPGPHSSWLPPGPGSPGVCLGVSGFDSRGGEESTGNSYLINHKLSEPLSRKSLKS